MTKRIRKITALLSALSLLTAGVISASAESYEEPIYEEPSYIEPSYVEPSYIEPSYDEPSYVEPSYDEPSYVDPGYDEPSYVDPGYVEPDYGNTGGGDNEVVYYDGDGNSYSDYSEMYVGGDQEYNPPASIAPSAALYDTSNTKVDEKTLSSSDWNDIKAKLANAGKKTDNNDSGDFAFIQQNTSDGDNGHRILIVGIALVVLGLAGITYLIVSIFVRRKQTALAHAAKAAAASNQNGSRYRSNSDYDDDFSAPKKSSKGGKRYK